MFNVIWWKCRSCQDNPWYIQCACRHRNANSKFKTANDVLSPKLSEQTPWDVWWECDLKSHVTYSFFCNEKGARYIWYPFFSWPFNIDARPRGGNRQTAKRFCIHSTILPPCCWTFLKRFTVQACPQPSWGRALCTMWQCVHCTTRGPARGGDFFARSPFSFKSRRNCVETDTSLEEAQKV